jgi:hypothetical protein
MHRRSASEGRNIFGAARKWPAAPDGRARTRCAGIQSNAGCGAAGSYRKPAEVSAEDLRSGADDEYLARPTATAADGGVVGERAMSSIANGSETLIRLRDAIHARTTSKPGGPRIYPIPPRWIAIERAIRMVLDVTYNPDGKGPLPGGRHGRELPGVAIV